ncbi:MAG: extracellular solute-binding protein [Clostridiales bacterium]|nr:extracellular solute-binding protein [Clostridiales bacterium]
MITKKTRYYLFSIVLIISILLTACGLGFTNQKQVSLTGKDTRDVLQFRITWKSYSGRGEAIKKIVDQYNSLNRTTYQVELVDGDEELETISSLLADANTQIDVYMLPYRYVQYFGYENLLEDMTADFAEEETIFYDTLWELGVVNQQTFGIPWMGHTMGLIYNRSLLDKAEVDPDTIVDLNTLVSACEQVEAKTEAKGIGLVGAMHNDVSWMVNQFVYGFGGSLVSDDGLRVTINSPQSNAALTFYKEVLGSHAQSGWVDHTGVEVMDAFRNQEIAFEIQGLWGVTDIWKSGDAFETGVIPLDSIGLFPEVGPMMLSLPKTLTVEKREAAIDFINYMISTTGQEMIMDGEYSPEHDTYYPFRIPVRTDMVENDVFDAYPELAKFIEGFSKPSIDVPVPLWQKVKEEYYEPGLHKVMTGEITIEEFLTEIEKEGTIILTGQ